MSAADDGPRYPKAGLEHHHGRAVWELGEDGDQFLVQGHGRRAVAAFSAFMRYLDGDRWHCTGEPLSFDEGHARFETTCGCTEEDHEAGHPRPVEEMGEFAHLFGDVEDGKVQTDCNCDNHGLPPCRDDWASWLADKVTPDAEGALPVTWVAVPR